MKKDLDLLLSEYSKSNKYPFHMPGHKRQGLVYGDQYDITEIEGFDNLQNPSEIISELEGDYARLYNSQHSHLLVNGSTVGNLASIYCLKDRGNTLLIGRNCHKSVYNAARVAGLELAYFYPRLDENGICQPVSVDDIKEAIQETRTLGQGEREVQIAGVVITSPTYEGFVSDIEGIGLLLHRENIPLVVDAAHGSHIKFLEQEDLTQEVAAADLTIMSLHKTLPTLNQSALLHVNGSLIEDELVKNAINIFQTTSPSYVIMASQAKNARFISEKPQAFEKYKQELERFYENTASLRSFTILNHKNKDLGKIVIICNKENYGGYELLEELDEKYDLVLEMASNHYAIAMTSLMDSREAFNRLEEALKEIDVRIEARPSRVKENLQLPRAAYDSNVGDKVANQDIYAYPPGSPIVAKGEVISKEALHFFKAIGKQE